jgi:hypothetical protein
MRSSDKRFLGLKGHQQRGVADLGQQQKGGIVQNLVETPVSQVCYQLTFGAFFACMPRRTRPLAQVGLGIVL